MANQLNPTQFKERIQGETNPTTLQNVSVKMADCIQQIRDRIQGGDSFDDLEYLDEQWKEFSEELTQKQPQHG